MSKTIEELNRLFKAAKLLAPEGMQDIPAYENLPALEGFLDESFQELDRKMMANPCREVKIEIPSDRELLALVKRKSFVEKYGAGYATPDLPWKFQLVYDQFANRQFNATSASDMVFKLFECCQELLDEYCIRSEPSSVELHVYRPPWNHPKAESRVHPRSKDPGRGQWIRVLDFRITEETPFINFEEFEYAHLELWPWMGEYARRSMNPCGELPLVEQKVGTFFPKT